jgi:hypothetical protein
MVARGVKRLFDALHTWRSPATVVRGTLRLPTAVVTGLLALFLVARVAIWFRATVFTSPDTPSYALRGDSTLDKGPLVSLTGHAPRLWGTSLFYAVFPNDTARTLAQWTLSTLAWLLLAWAVWGCLRAFSVRVLAAAGVLTVGLLPQVTNWDFAILSESLSISLGVLTLALLLWWLATGSRPALVALTLAAGWWTFVRPEIRLMVALVAAVLVSRAWRDGGQRRPAAIAAAVLLIAMAWVTLITPAMSRTYAERSWNGLSIEESTLVYRLRFQVMAEPAVMAVFKDKLGMPDCAEAERIAAGGAWEISRFIISYQACPDLVRWGERNATNSGYRFAVVAPDLYAWQTVGLLPTGLEGKIDAQGTRILPTIVERAAFPRRSLLLPLLLGGVAVAMAAGFALGAHRRRPLLVGTAVVLTAGSLASLVVGFMYAAGDYPRFGIQEAIGVRLGLLLLAAAVVDTLLERVRLAAPHASQRI